VTGWRFLCQSPTVMGVAAGTCSGIRPLDTAVRMRGWVRAGKVQVQVCILVQSLAGIHHSLITEVWTIHNLGPS